MAHGLALLEAFDAGHAALTNKDLANRSGLSKATVSRLSSTLQTQGLLECVPGERRYRLGSAPSPWTIRFSLGWTSGAGRDWA